jgi:hypothetical protein
MQHGGNGRPGGEPSLSAANFGEAFHEPVGGPSIVCRWPDAWQPKQELRHSPENWV